MLCNIKPVPFHESNKHIFAKIPGGVRTPGPPLWIRPCITEIKPLKVVCADAVLKIASANQNI